MAEFALIDRLRRRAQATARARPDVALGIGDDAALLDPPPGQQLVIAVDTLVDGVHFPRGTHAFDVGWKALAVNLSDLAAMGASPAAALLALTLPDGDAGFVDGFAEGFAALADAHGVALVGGDTTRGPLSASVTVIGWLPTGTALTRAGARPGDDVWVTGTLGDAAAALAHAAAVAMKGALAQAGARGAACSDARGWLRGRLDRPTPRVGAGLALRGLASACIDVSDGLLADLGHVLAASGVAADIDADALPASAALLEAVPDRAERRALQVAGGDDYELCFTAPAAQREAVRAALDAAATPATRIGSITAGSVTAGAIGVGKTAAGTIDAGPTLRLRDANGRPLPLPARRGWTHFAGSGA